MTNAPCSGLTDYHVHTPLCLHAQGWPVDFAARAVKLGLAELGIADHNPMPERFDDWRMLREDLPAYFESVEKARVAFPGMPIRIGLEMNYLPGMESWWEALKAHLPEALLGLYLNPDEIEAETKSQGYTDFSKFEIITSVEEIFHLFERSELLRQRGLDETLQTVAGRSKCTTCGRINRVQSVPLLRGENDST